MIWLGSAIMAFKTAITLIFQHSASKNFRDLLPFCCKCFQSLEMGHTHRDNQSWVMGQFELFFVTANHPWQASEGHQQDDERLLLDVAPSNFPRRPLPLLKSSLSQSYNRCKISCQVFWGLGQLSTLSWLQDECYITRHHHLINNTAVLSQWPSKHQR